MVVDRGLPLGEFVAAELFDRRAKLAGVLAEARRLLGVVLVDDLSGAVHPVVQACARNDVWQPRPTFFLRRT